jgi:hypothetical protein
MKTFNGIPWFVAPTILVLAIGIGCSSTDSGARASGGVYYGAGWNDPWYYGPGYYPPDVIITPPPGKPESKPRPTQPIARPPASAPRPMPSIPSAPRGSRR